MRHHRQRPATLFNVTAGMVVCASLVLVAACSTSTTTGATTSNPSPAAPATPTTEASPAYGQQVQSTVLDGLMTNDYQRPATFSDMCTTVVVWACAIAKIESDGPGTVDITLAPESVWIDKWDGSTDWYDFGEYVARGVYNFTQDQVQPPLSQIDVLTSEGDIAYLGNY